MADDLRMALTILLRKAEMAGDVDFLRDGVRILGQTLMDLEASQHLRAEENERTPERAGHRNGTALASGTRGWEPWSFRSRGFGMAPSSPACSIRAGGPSALLVGVVQEAYVQGVSTRRVDELVKALVMTGISKSRVSRLCHDEWQVSKRCFSAESLAKVTGRLDTIPLPLAAAK